MWVSRYFTSSLGKKSLMAVSGWGLALFLMVHLAGNATTFFGRDVFNSYAAHLDALSVVVHCFEVLLLLFFLVHVFTGVTLYVENLKARPKRYKVSRIKGRNLASWLAPYTGFLTFVFLAVHLMNFRFAHLKLPVADAVRQLLHRPVFAFFYMIAMVGVGFHICHGLWSMLQSLGINHPKYNPLLEKGAVTVGIIMASIFFLIPLLALLVNGFLR